MHGGKNIKRKTDVFDETVYRDENGFYYRNKSNGF